MDRVRVVQAWGLPGNQRSGPLWLSWGLLAGIPLTSHGAPGGPMAPFQWGTPPATGAT